jgi:hypothetical protein
MSEGKGKGHTITQQPSPNIQALGKSHNRLPEMTLLQVLPHWIGTVSIFITSILINVVQSHTETVKSADVRGVCVQWGI